MNDKIVGKCSNCGGEVRTSTVQHSTKPMTPTCTSCGYVQQIVENLPEIKTVPLNESGKQFLQD